MKRSRLLTIGAAVALLVATAAGGSYVATHGARASASSNPYQLSSNALQHAHPRSTTIAPAAGVHGKSKNHSGPGIDGADSLDNFSSVFRSQGVAPNGAANNLWHIDTVGNDPAKGGTTNINAPIIPVTVNLLDSSGNVALTSSPDGFVQPLLNSPVFSNNTYSSSSTPTQFTDAVQRAEFWHTEAKDWHTMLAPSVKTGRTMNIPAGKYFFALNSDGSCCAFVLVDINTFGSLLFPSTFPVDNSTPVGAAENAGDITTKDMSTFLFPNTYLYFNGDPNQCCVLGFHTYDFEPGDASNGNRERRYVLNYSSWISPGLFGGGFSDVTATSHEIAESYNDPFVGSDGFYNMVPWWLSGAECQNLLEDGDVIESLDNPTVEITMNGMTYHPQDEPTIQWFMSNPHSDAIDGAFSYPNETVLTKANVSQLPGCAGPFRP